VRLSVLSTVVAVGSNTLTGDNAGDTFDITGNMLAT